MQNVWPPYFINDDSSKTIKAVSASGSKIFFSDNSWAYDGISSWWSVCHGHSHQNIVSAIKSAADKLSHVMFGGITHDYAENLASNLAKFTSFDRAFFCDSGSIATEIALKISLQYWENAGKSNKTNFIAIKNCYHGETFGASAVSSNSQKFGQYMSNFVHILDLPDENTLEKFEQSISQICQKSACIILEPLMQGAGGVFFYSAEVLDFIIKTAHKYDVLVILDECATGFYRLGSKFAFMQTNQKPDIITLGKALSGGHIPFAAVMTKGNIFQTTCKTKFMHGPTFMANPIACAASNASLEIFLQNDYLKMAEEISDAFATFGSKMQTKYDMQFRYNGAVLACNFEFDLQKARNFIAKNISQTHLWMRPMNNTFYLMPPLNIASEDLNHTLEGFEYIMSQIRQIA